MLINWDRIGREVFDRAVEALIAYRYEDAEVTAFDGKGGDGGRDVVVRQGDRVRIFQLKYFPEGFSSTWVQRRKQIKKSFTAALDHEPYEWTLVVPKNLTEGEQTYIAELTRNSGIEVINWWGRAELDQNMAGFPDLRRYIDSDTAREYLEAVGRRNAFIETGSGLMSNLVDLRRAADAADPHWTLDFATKNDTITQTLRAKHPNAHNLSPVTLKFNVEGSRLEPTVKEQFERMLNFGRSGEVKMMVSNFTVDGPPLVASSSDGGYIVLRSIDPEPAKVPVEFRFFNKEGAQIGSHTGFPTYVGEGRAGSSFTVNFYSGLRVGMDIPKELTAPGKLEIDIDVDEADPITVIQVDRMLRSISQSDRMDVLVAGHRLVSTTTSGNRWIPEGGDSDDWKYLVSLCEDLDVITRETGTGFVVPTTVGAKDRVFVRCARLLLEGKCVVVPDQNVLNARVRKSGGLDWGALLGGDGALCLVYERYGFELFSREVQLGRAVLFTAGYAVNSAETEELLRGSDDLHEEMEVKIRPRDARSWWTYLADRYTDSGPVRPVPWGIEGFTEPKDVEAP